jgi:hypothetical protein
MALDFARARRHAFLTLLALYKIKDVFLPLSEHDLRLRTIPSHASSNEHFATHRWADL